MIIDTVHPPDHDWNGLVFRWERDLDPWHADAFPDEFKHAGTGGRRKAGWGGYDWAGNMIIFVADTFLPCDGKDKTQLDESITYHRHHCPVCDVHLTSLLHCPECNTRYELF